MKDNFTNNIQYSPLRDGDITEAIILAGGLGTRLKSVVPDLPKCMAPVNGKPFIVYVIEHLHEQGINKFILSLGYKYEIITKYIDSIKSQLQTGNRKQETENSLLTTHHSAKEC